MPTMYYAPVKVNPAHMTGTSDQTVDSDNFILTLQMVEI